MNSRFAFIDETGIAENAEVPQPFFGIGFLKVDRASEISENLFLMNYNISSQLRSKRKDLISALEKSPRILTGNELNLLMAKTRHYEYKFSYISYDNLSRYISLIDKIHQFKFHFCSLIINKNDPLFNAQVYGNYWHACAKYTKLIADKNCKNDEKLIVISDYMTKPKASTICYEDELMKSKNIINVIRAHSATFPLLQVCDLFLGSVIFQWKEQYKLNTNSRHVQAKREFVNYLITKMTIPTYRNKIYPLSQAITINKPFYFSVWPFRLK